MSLFTTSINLACLVIGALLVGSGAWGVADPLSTGRWFGVPTATPANVVFYPGIGGRNLAAGLAVWALTLTGQRKALGMFFLCWMFVGLADTKIVYEHPDGQKVDVHMRNVGILLVVGITLLRM